MGEPDVPVTVVLHLEMVDVVLGLLPVVVVAVDDSNAVRPLLPEPRDRRVTPSDIECHVRREVWVVNDGVVNLPSGF